MLVRPPICRAVGGVLDRSLFTKRVPVSAARVLDSTNISKYRKQFSQTKELLMIDRVAPICRDPEPTLAAQGRKCLLLKPDVKPNGGLCLGACGELRLLTHLTL